MEEILELAGCDLSTISPTLLEELKSSEEKVEKKLDAEVSKSSDIQKLELDETKFRQMFKENQMASDKLDEGIKKFSADILKLEEFVVSKM